ncbi:MAG: excinuclease ABC subunit UvrA [Vulcanimicrobiota bacterium]
MTPKTPDSLIRIRGAREHNLKNINLDLPRDQLVVITGLSGSGKSSLAFDTLYAEGQRRYVESLSAYARQFLGLMEKPDVDLIEGLSPAISIDQKGSSRNPRSTVGTVTEIYDYLRLMFARIGQPHCPGCGKAIHSQTVDQMVDTLLGLGEGAQLTLLAPMVRGRKGEYSKLFKEIQSGGFTRVRVDGQVRRLDEDEIVLEKYVKHTIEVVVDRITVRAGVRSRLAESIETCLGLAAGLVQVHTKEDREILLSSHLACADCGISFEELAPRLFSFNSPFGACPKCHGLGFLPELDPALVIPDPTLSIEGGAIAPWGKPVLSMRHQPRESRFWRRLNRIAEEMRIDLRTPWKLLPEKQRDIILNGCGERFEGAIPALQGLYTETESEYFRSEIEKYMTERACPACDGARLKPEALAVQLHGLNVHQLCSRSVREALAWVEALKLSDREQTIAHQVLKEIHARLRFLNDVGLDYLTLTRTASTLSGGESQRIRLATQIGSGLVGVLYILDEPSIGLHQRDNARLLETLTRLRNLGNTLIVVEHDEDTIRAADHVVDVGPGAGIHGGHIVAQGTPEQVEANPASLTGAYLSGRQSIEVPRKRRKTAKDRVLRLKGARQNNLQNLTVDFPVGVFTCVTGVSGSGKSTLVNQLLTKALSGQRGGAYDSLDGQHFIDRVIVIDQSPIGRTPRSNPATYTGIFDPIRKVFAATPEARMRGYQPGRFSFNVKGGRCEACQGQGILKIEMHFLPDVYVPCEVCKGKRYNRETLEVRFKGKTITEVLEMTIDESLELFANIPTLARRIQTLADVGLGYISLGQAATTLSGGEAQRVKLASELSKQATGRTAYILDEPTTGLHFHDVSRLLEVLQRLTDAGNTMIIIEHNLDVIKCADWIIDLGPHGGDRGGQLLVAGTPEKVAECSESYTGHFLKPILEKAGTLKEKRKKVGV